MTVKPSWIAVDWDLDSPCAWAMSATNDVLEMRAVFANAEPCTRPPAPVALQRLARTWGAPDNVPILLCGGSSDGQNGILNSDWISVPTTPFAARPVQLKTDQTHGDIYLVRGLAQQAPPSLVWGPETKVAGLLAMQPDFDGVVCLPGQHTCWARVSAGEIVSFECYSSVMLCDAIASHTVLVHSLGAGELDSTSLETGLVAALNRNHSALSGAFALRAESLLKGLKPSHAQARLLGHIVGSEVLSARAYWLDRNVTIIGEQNLSAIYQSALGLAGNTCQIADREDTVLRGLIAARNSLQETTE